ncbi:MAG: PHP domain-containing protein [Syntrophomonadaceae bacterium]|nr:PHP domain-containing protein [Syntrophomonadaceae bacterium]
MITSTIDLHIHTTASDGNVDPVTMLEEVIKAGITTFSFTDHESIDGIDSVAELCPDRGLNLIPGVELSTFFQGREIHLLGYWFDVDKPGFRSWIKELQSRRNQTMIQIADNLWNLGLKLDRAPIYAVADKGSVGKNHLIKALFKAGYLNSKEEAIDVLRSYLGPKGLAYVDFDFNPYVDAVQSIRESGGIPVLAHPGLIRDDKMVLDLLDAAPVGLEVYYHYFGSNRQELIAHYEQMGIERGLVLTGGSDYHGNYSPDVKLGKVLIPSKLVEELARHRH